MMSMSTSWARWEQIRSSFWFLPAAMALLGWLLATLLLFVDGLVPDALLVESRMIISAAPSEQRTLLLALAGATVGTAGVVFSLATVPLSVAASQFGSRLLRAFLRDPVSQIVMGCFTATVVYCVFVAMAVPQSPEASEQPFIATTASIGLVVISFCSVIYLINHLGTLLQAPFITHRVGTSLNRAICDYTAQRPTAGRATAEEALLGERIAAGGEPVLARRTGYVEAVDGGRMAGLARQGGLVILLRAVPGAFVMEGEVLARAQPAGRLSAERAAAISACFLLGMQRSLVQDVGFGLNQLVEIALRALSPAINDPLTAMNCLDRLGDSLRLLAAGPPPPNVLRDDAGDARVLFAPAGFVDLAEAALSPIRQYGGDSAMVLGRLVEVIVGLAPYAHRPEDRAALARHLELVAEAGAVGLATEAEREALRRQVRGAAGLLATAAVGAPPS